MHGPRSELERREEWRLELGRDGKRDAAGGDEAEDGSWLGGEAEGTPWVK